MSRSCDRGQAAGVDRRFRRGPCSANCSICRTPRVAALGKCLLSDCRDSFGAAPRTLGVAAIDRGSREDRREGKRVDPPFAWGVRGAEGRIDHDSGCVAPALLSAVMCGRYPETLRFSRRGGTDENAGPLRRIWLRRRCAGDQPLRRCRPHLTGHGRLSRKPTSTVPRPWWRPRKPLRHGICDFFHLSAWHYAREAV